MDVFYSTVVELETDTRERGGRSLPAGAFGPCRSTANTGEARLLGRRDREGKQLTEGQLACVVNNYAVERGPASAGLYLWQIDNFAAITGMKSAGCMTQPKRMHMRPRGGVPPPLITPLLGTECRCNQGPVHTIFVLL